MRFFFDTEFIEDGRTIDLISIGIVAEDGRKLYLQNADCKFELANDWVARNVFPSLVHFQMGRNVGRTCAVRTPNHDMSMKDVSQRDSDPLCPWRAHHAIRDEVKRFIGEEKPEFWAYYADYDWVVFCQLFGRMVDLPHGWPRYCNDIKQWGEQLDIAPPHDLLGDQVEHNALSDAGWNREAWLFLAQFPRPDPGPPPQAPRPLQSEQYGSRFC